MGARTERKKSEEQFLGLVVTSGPGPLEVVEGGPPSLISITSTVPILCSPQDRAFGECCVHLELAMNEIDEEQHCPQGNPLDRVCYHFNSNPLHQNSLAAAFCSSINCCE